MRLEGWHVTAQAFPRTGHDHRVQDSVTTRRRDAAMGSQSSSGVVRQEVVE
jgi:hypothetical protein